MNKQVELACEGTVRTLEVYNILPLRKISKATKATERMLMSAARAVSSHKRDRPTKDGVLPPLADVPELSLLIARAVADAAVADGVADPFSEDVWTERLATHRWTPEYPTVIPA